MRRTIKIKANIPKDPTLNLLETCAKIFNLHIDWCFDNKSYNKNKAHKVLYFSIRKQFPNIPAALIQSIRDMALESVKSIKFKFKPNKTKTSGIRFDKRCCSLRGNLLSISTLGKRYKTFISIPKHFQDIFNSWKFTGLQLTYDKNKDQFYFNLNYECESPSFQQGDVLGIDRGIINTVSCSDGTQVSGKHRNKIKRKINYLRRKLQAKGTRSAKRLLRKLRRREKRFSLNENHIIAKQVANLPFQVFVLEKLIKMNKKNKGKRMNRRVSNWSYYQFEQLLKYKTETLSKKVEYVDARYTSQRCDCCGSIDKRNRKKEKFKCVNCGHKDGADRNAANNIRDLWLEFQSSPNQIPQGQASVNMPNVLSNNGKETLPSYCKEMNKPTGSSCG